MGERSTASEETRPPHPGVKDHLGLLLLAGMWGSAFLFIEEALSGFAPLQLAAGRILIAALLLVLMAALRKEHGPRTTAERWRLVLAGWSGASVPFALIAWGQQHVTSAEAAILMSFTPLATAILAHLFLRDEPLGRARLVGILVGMAGVALLVGAPRPFEADTSGMRHLLAGLAILGGAFRFFG
ncbi:MAG: EamA family transporter, partial [Alphaproteobacteria bacterium]